MRKLLFTSILLSIAAVSFSQMSSFPGYSTGNYAGVNATFFNPARIADSRYRWDFNLSSVNVGIGTTAEAFKLGDIQTLFQSDLGQQLFPGTSKISGNVNMDIIGPSILFNANKKNSFALTSRMRAVATIINVDPAFGQIVVGSAKELPTYPYNSTDDVSTLNLNAWKEYGLSYGRVISDKGKNFFSGGISIKYLSGTGNVFLQGTNYNLNVDKDILTGDSYLKAGSYGRVAVGVGGIDINNASFNDILKSNGSGVGVDIGFEYQWRPNIEKYKMDTRKINNQYKLKFGAALLDVGKIKYTRDANKTGTYDFKANTNFYLDAFTDKDPDTYKSVFDAHPEAFSAVAGTSSGSYKVSLPMSLQLYTDLNIKGGLFLNLTGQIAMTKKSSAFDPLAYSGVTFTPRFENKTFAAFIPLNYNNLTKFNAGLSIKAGPIFFGSGSFLSALLDKSKQLDAHFGIRFGVFHKREKNMVVREPSKVKVSADTDGDGIPDTEDKCPTVPGFPKYQGCPIPDTDGDGINDEEDKCPTVPGLAKYQGCPIPDTDGDGINDEEDKCPTVPGVARYQGCPIPDTDGDGINDEEDKCPTVKGLTRYQGCPIPDTDGDGVNDEEDKCPTVAGPASNFGCPVIEKKIIEKINLAAKNIFFATGSAKLLSKSYGPLNTVVKVLKDNPTFNADIEGHTDIRGKADMNRVLSQNRANAVVAYLKSKGIDEKRLTGTGFGPDKPIASNKTAAGMAKNRRVEIHLRNY